MIKFVTKPERIKAAGKPPKLIEEYFGLINTGDIAVSIARMTSPPGWSEPGQQPEFNEYTVVLKGYLQVKLRDQTIKVKAGQGILIHADEWVQYSTPGKYGAEYIAVCIPAFSNDTVNRDQK